jgi:hypothetical protein
MSDSNTIHNTSTTNTLAWPRSPLNPVVLHRQPHPPVAVAMGPIEEFQRILNCTAGPSVHHWHHVSSRIALFASNTSTNSGACRRTSGLDCGAVMTPTPTGNIAQ